MRAESTHHIIHKADHWPINKRREYLILALKCEKNRRRRSKITLALREMTITVLKQEVQHVRD